MPAGAAGPVPAGAAARAALHWIALDCRSAVLCGVTALRCSLCAAFWARPVGTRMRPVACCSAAYSSQCRRAWPRQACMPIQPRTYPHSATLLRPRKHFLRVAAPPSVATETAHVATVLCRALQQCFAARCNVALLQRCFVVRYTLPLWARPGTSCARASCATRSSAASSTCTTR